MSTLHSALTIQKIKVANNKKQNSMKKIRIPFSLSEYEKGGYEVETRDGRSARIVCTDCMSSY